MTISSILLLIYATGFVAYGLKFWFEIRSDEGERQLDVLQEQHPMIDVRAVIPYGLLLSCALWPLNIHKKAWET